MDGERFDRFTRWLGGTHSRRVVLRGVALAAGARLIGRREAFAQALIPPLPNFPFLPVLPTDKGFEQYQLDRYNAGGPRLFVDVASPLFLNKALQATFGSSFRAGYRSTVVLPNKSDATKTDRSITSFIYDCGSTKDAKAVFDAYTAALATAGATAIAGVKPIGKEAAILGCNGLCETNLNDLSRGGSTGGAFAVSYRGRFLSDIRVRSLIGETITGADARAAARFVDGRVKEVGAVAMTTGTLRAFVPEPGDAEPDAAAAISPFASYNTTPIFSFAGEAPGQSAWDFLRVKDGMAIPLASPLDDSNKTRQQEATRDGYSDVIHNEQVFSTAKPYRTDYYLASFYDQYIFPTADLRQAYFDSYRDKQLQDQPSLTFTDVNATASQKMFAFEVSLGETNGTWSGFETYAQVDSPLGPVMFDISLVAIPTDPKSPPPAVADVSSELGAAVFEMQTIVMQCLLQPETCPASVELRSNPTTAGG